VVLEALFVDSAGVLVDISDDVMSRVWRERIGEFCAPRLGGTPGRWAAANRDTNRQFERWYHEAARAQGGAGHAAFVPWADRRWIEEMCVIVGVAVPADPAAFADACVRFVAAGAAPAAFPDAVAGVRALASRVARLFTATSQESRQIDGYLRAMGIRDAFERTYGGDLVDRFKINAEFFRAIMADADVAPERSAMIDDNPKYLNWAREAGMTTYLLERRGEDPEGHQAVSSLAALAERLS
jgi:FMN phosphatase YigB (HAD superfamily)